MSSVSNHHFSSSSSSASTYVAPSSLTSSSSSPTAVAGNPPPLSLSSRMVTLDKICDYIPGISTISNLVDLFQKYVFPIPSMNKTLATKSHYYTHLEQKDWVRCLWLLIPVVGNIIVALFDYFTREKNPEPVIDVQPTIIESRFKALDRWASDALAGGNKFEAIARIKDCYNANGKKLDLSGLNLTSLPISIPLPHLEELNLSNNQLELFMPASFPNLQLFMPASFPNLQKLDLSHNKFAYFSFASVPPGVQDLNLSNNRSLSNLYARHNVFPEKLKKLDVTNTAISNSGNMPFNGSQCKIICDFWK